MELQQVIDSFEERFSKAVESQGWRSQEQELAQIYKRDKDSFALESQNIMLKIMSIPSSQQKYADKLLSIFGLMYQSLIKTIKKENAYELEALLTPHLETAYKLVQHQDKNKQQRAYNWLASILECASDQFLSVLKKRMMKCIFTHAIEMLSSENQSIKSEPLRLNAVKVAAKFQVPVKIRGDEGYKGLIRRHLIKTMMDDDCARIRKEVIKRIEMKDNNLSFVIKRIHDVHSGVRAEVYKRLQDCKIDFDELDCDDRLDIILTGLKDEDKDVVFECKTYLVSSICASPGEIPEIVRQDGNLFQKQPRKYRPHQLMPLNSILKILNLKRSYNSPHISEAISLLFKQILIPTYGNKAILEQTEKTVAHLASNDRSMELDDLYESLIFLNFSLFNLMELEHMHPNEIQLQYKKHVPIIRVIQEVIQYSLSIYQSDERSTFENKLPSLIIYQLLHIIQKTLPYLKQKSQKEELNELLQDFLSNSGWLHVQLDNKEEEQDMSCIEEIKEEDQSLSDFGISIGQREILIQIAIQIIRHQNQNDNVQFLKMIQKIIKEIRSLNSESQTPIKLNSLSQKERVLRLEFFNLNIIVKGMKAQGLSVDQQQIKKLEELEEKIQKITKKSSKIQIREVKNTRHYLTVLKYFLKSVKIGTLPESDVPSIEQIYAEHLHSQEPQLKLLALECLTLMMILNKEVFEQNLKTVMECIDEESLLRKKNKKSIVCLKGIFDCLIVHEFMIDQDIIQEIIRQELRALILRQLRDCDYNIRLLATEGCTRLLLCAKIANPWDFIARLILLYFERSKSQENFTQQKLDLQTKIKKTLEQFFKYLPRLSFDRCIELFGGTILAVFFLMKSSSQEEIQSHWSSINTFYLFGTMSDALKYRLNNELAIFSQAERDGSFQASFFKFFAFLLLGDSTTYEEKNQFALFVAYYLQFLDFEEVPMVVSDYESMFKDTIFPLFNHLYNNYQTTNEKATIWTCWRNACCIYMKRKYPQERSQIFIDEKVNKLMAEQTQRSINFDEDEQMIFKHCQSFYQGLLKQSKDHKKVQSQGPYNQGLETQQTTMAINHKREAEKALKHLKKKVPTMRSLMKDQDRKGKKPIVKSEIGNNQISQIKKRDQKQFEKQVKREDQQLSHNYQGNARANDNFGSLGMKSSGRSYDNIVIKTEKGLINAPLPTVNHDLIQTKPVVQPAAAPIQIKPEESSSSVEIISDDEMVIQIPKNKLER